jgi:hypothetical protein
VPIEANNITNSHRRIGHSVSTATRSLRGGGDAVARCGSPIANASAAPAHTITTNVMVASQPK